MRGMIRDSLENVRAVVTIAYELAYPKGEPGDQYETGYRQGVLDLAGELLWPDEDRAPQRDRLSRLFDAHRALFVEAPS